MDAAQIPLRWLKAPAAGARPTESHARRAVRILAVPLALLALAAALRVVPWLANYPLHDDEALYGFYARLIQSGRDPFLLTPWIDKPPLALYLMAASLKLFGVSERALRVPGLLAGLLALPCVYGLAGRAYASASGPDRRVAALAALLFAASPFAILFAPTAFTDPWLVLFMLAGAWAALSGRPFVAGVALGLAIASKQQGVLAAPLIAGLLALGDAARSRMGPRHTLGRWLRLGLGCALVFAPLVWWDSLRWSNRPSFWDRSAMTYGGLALAAPATWPERARAWAGWLGYLYGTPVLSALALLLAAAPALYAVYERCGSGFRPRKPRFQTHSHAASRGPTPVSPRPPVDPATRAHTRAGLLLSAYIVAYLGLHFFTTFQPWDRYLLPLAPLVAILAARSLVRGWDWLAGNAGRATRYALASVGVALVAWAAGTGAAARIPVGSDHGAYRGLDRVVATLRSRPADTVIYDRWLGWQYDFYLFDAPQERRWWDTPWKLADDAAATHQAQPERAQWLAMPDWRDEAMGDVGLALAARGLVPAERARVYRPDGSRSFTLYEIVARPHGG